MKLGAIKRWTVDWRGEGAPNSGDVIRYVTPTGVCTFARVASVRVVKNRNALADGVTCRYAMGIERLTGRPVGSTVAWTLYAQGRKCEFFKRSNRFSPLLDA